MAGDRVNAVMNLVSNAMVITGAALLLIGVIGLILTSADEDERGGMEHDDADH